MYGYVNKLKIYIHISEYPLMGLGVLWTDYEQTHAREKSWESLINTLHTYDPLSNGCKRNIAQIINIIIEDKITFQEDFSSGIENKMPNSKTSMRI